MKTIIVLIFFALAFCLQAQNEPEKTYKNEFGIDATSFIVRFLKIDVEEFGYTPNYYLTYRRKFQCGNIRFAIGGDYEQTNISSPLLMIKTIIILA